MGFPGLSAPSAWAVLQRQGSAAEERYSQRKDVAREVARFREAVPKLSDPEALLKNRRALEFVLESYGLEGEIFKKAILRKLMTEDPDARGSLAGQMTDARYRQFARDFSKWDVKNPFTKPRAVETLVARWTTSGYEQQAGTDNPGLREALYFKRNIGNATAVVQVMADPAMAYVARVALGLPSQFTALDFQQQKTILTKRLNMADFQDPRKVDQFLKRFLVRYEQENGGPQATDLRTQLFGGGNAGTSGLFGLLGSRLNLRI
jgi:hypothetical protein